MNTPELTAASNADAITATLNRMGQAAREAATAMARASTVAKNRTLTELAGLLLESVDALQAANAQDVSAAQAAGLAEPMVDRLRLTPKVIATVAEGC